MTWPGLLLQRSTKLKYSADFPRNALSFCIQICSTIKQDLDDFALSEFYGEITIGEIAENSDARQSNDNILLSDTGVHEIAVSHEIASPKFLTPDGGANILIPCRSNTRHKS
jgi:hypothetical protein